MLKTRVQWYPSARAGKCRHKCSRCSSLRISVVPIRSGNAMSASKEMALLAYKALRSSSLIDNTCKNRFSFIITTHKQQFRFQHRDNAMTRYLSQAVFLHDAPCDRNNYEYNQFVYYCPSRVWNERNNSLLVTCFACWLNFFLFFFRSTCKSHHHENSLVAFCNIHWWSVRNEKSCKV